MKVSIDPDAGGATIVSGGHPPTILAAGYVGSTIFGGLFIMAGFDTLVAKIMSFVIGIGLVAPLALVRDKLCVPFVLLVVVFARALTASKYPIVCALTAMRVLGFLREQCALPRPCATRTILLTVLYEGLLIGFWFIDHGCVYLLSTFERGDIQYFQASATLVLFTYWRDEVRGVLAASY